jgi:hypothetical protein
MAKRLILAILAVLLVSFNVMAAGTVTVAFEEFPKTNFATLTFTCTGDASDGTIPATSTDNCTTDAGAGQDISSSLYGYYFHRMINYNLTSQTDCTANSDVYIKDNSGDGSYDLIGGDGVDELDNDTTNGKRLNSYDSIIGPITYSVANQSATSAEWVTIFVLVK